MSSLRYVAKRILTDGSPRAASALASFVYGPTRELAPADRYFDVERLECVDSPQLSSSMNERTGLVWLDLKAGRLV